MRFVPSDEFKAGVLEAVGPGSDAAAVERAVRLVRTGARVVDLGVQEARRFSTTTAHALVGRWLAAAEPERRAIEAEPLPDDTGAVLLGWAGKVPAEWAAEALVNVLGTHKAPQSFMRWLNVVRGLPSLEPVELDALAEQHDAEQRRRLERVRDRIATSDRAWNRLVSRPGFRVELADLAPPPVVSSDTPPQRFGF